MIESGESKYIIPTVDGTPIVLDIAAVVKAESRLQEVENTNTHNAPELLSTYNKHWLTLHEAVAKVTHERNKADEQLKVTIAECILECNDEVIKKKGHSKSSQDLREALVTIDPKVRLAKERLNEIKAILEYLNGKRQAFENAWRSVKSLVSSAQPPPGKLNFGGNPVIQIPSGSTASKPQIQGFKINDTNIPFHEMHKAALDLPSTDYELPEGFEEFVPRRNR